jgi:hypothetical protein
LTTDADRSSFFIALVVIDVLVCLADAISGPFIVLFLVGEARFDPLSLSAILTARALSGIAFGTGFGALIDKRTSVAPLLIALGGSALGYGLLNPRDRRLPRARPAVRRQSRRMPSVLSQNPFRPS